MSRDPAELPEFVRDLESDEPDAPKLDLEPVLRLPELVGIEPEPDAAQAVAVERLMQSVADFPLRYAPFFARAALLWDLTESAVEAVFARAADARAWSRTPLPGVRLINVQGGPATRGSLVRLVRFGRGMRFPRHRHTGFEAVLVIDGSYVDSSGRTFRPGDMQEMAAGSEHGFTVSEQRPCVSCIVQSAIEFKNPILRLIGKFYQ